MSAGLHANVQDTTKPVIVSWQNRQVIRRQGQSFVAGIFKAYDIRGIYGDTLTDDTAHAIGRAFVDFLGCRRVVVGRDM
ncbi:MAG: hypothetical protein RLW62_19770, partial [Gammaproteobacteria bacterium]